MFKKPVVRNTLKTILALSILLYLFSKVDLKTFSSIARTIKPGYISLALIISFCSMFLSSYKWHLLLRSRNVRINYINSTKAYFVGNFFNSFLPGTVGGDVVKIYRLRDTTDKFEDIFSTTLMDRFIGFVASLVMIIFAAVLNLGIFESNNNLLFVILILSTVTLLFLLLLFNKPLFKKLDFIYKPAFKLLKFMNLEEKCARLYNSTHNFRHQIPVLAANFGLSLAVKVLYVVLSYFVGLSVNLGVDLYYFFVFVPLVGCLSLIPVSFNGLGVREGISYLFYTRAGAEIENILIYSLLTYLVALVISILGGVVYVYEELTDKKERT
ncbi:MAG: lysylphosphatidylglycerol synthase transmembrane domain-containing protein [Candidatus Omnitrophica bacterium]|nr:lysylphosphatidylglycerol synthase transmembrane domain-containing protein [Candidatus Omnitrophota bacterium]MDD5488844.1 lysylphosphatidylglycerol synthase transmembrane domain-containing protein [Candidatus Omnitrophota bacterium]